MNQASRLSPPRGDANASDTSSGQTAWPGSPQATNPDVQTGQQTEESQADAEKRRRERKRFTDKLAQRHHRKRQKLYIEELEGRLNMLKSGSGVDSGPAELVAQNLRLQEELKQINSLWDEMEALMQRYRQVRRQSVLNTATGNQPPSYDPTKNASRQHRADQNQNLPIHDPSQQPPRTGLRDIGTVGDAENLNEGHHTAHMDALMVASGTDAASIGLDTMASSRNTADVPFDRGDLDTTTTSADMTAPTETNISFNDQSRQPDGDYADMVPEFCAFDALSRLLQQTDTALQDFNPHSHPHPQTHPHPHPLYHNHNHSHNYESSAQMQQFELANMMYLAASPRQNSTGADPDDPLQKDSRQSLNANIWPAGAQPLASYLLSPPRGSPIPSGHNPWRQASPIASSALSIKNMIDLLGVDFGDWLPSSSPLVAAPMASGKPESRALPLNQNPPSQRDREVSTIIDRARANIESVGPPTLVDFLFDNPKNTLSIDLKKLLEPVRQRRRTSEFLATYWVLYLLFRWQIVRDEEAYQNLPTWLRPTRLQLTVSHPVAADLVAWPEMREALIHMSMSDEIGLYDVSRDIVRYLTVDIQTPDQAALNDPKRLEAEILDLRNWKLGHGFFDRYPHWKRLLKGNDSLGLPSNSSNPSNLSNLSNTSRTDIGTNLS